MEINNDQNSDSPSKNSYIGSYYQPPDRIASVSRHLEFPAHPSVHISPTPSHLSRTMRNIDSKGVVDALKTLQEKIGRLELERKHAQRRHLQLSIAAQKHRQASSSRDQPTTSPPESDTSAQKELDSKLQSAEARCKILEKQLDYMKKMIENTKKGRSDVMENQASLQRRQTDCTNGPTQQEKLEKLESEYLKLRRTQTEAEMKLALLEQKMLKEEHERKLMQEKAEELQRELDINLRLSVPRSEETHLKRTTKNKTSKHDELVLGSERRIKAPFVAGTSTSPSHSVHANVQTILHMMKHHHPHLYEQVSALQRSGPGAKKSLHKEFSASFPKPESPSEDQSLGSLSDLLLALQDELGQMSFERQELERRIDATQNQEEKNNLQREVERQVTRMEEKEAQIMKLRKHQQLVHRLTQSRSQSKKPSGIRPLVISPVKTTHKAKKHPVTFNNLQLLRETRKFRNSLKQDDLFWET